MDDEPSENPYNLLSFRPVDDPPGLTIVDHVERRQCTLNTPEAVDPTEAPRDEFYFPVDRGVEIFTARLSFPNKVAVYVRNHAGIMVSELTEGDSIDFPSDLYSIELCAPIKIYLSFEDSFSARVTTEGVTIDIPTANKVLVGVRSHHESPAGTIMTTSDPEDMMVAISHFGSALKTTTPEQSYPTLRGHPPTLNLSDELQIPPVIDEPDNGIRLILPLDYQFIYVASTLAYYLGASVKPGHRPRLETDKGFTYDFDTDRDKFETEIERVLKQIFFLDCIVRTEGYYPVNLFERKIFEEQNDIDFRELYHKDMSERIDSYLNIPYSVVAPYLPKWKLTAHTTLKAKHIELIPFLVYDLAIIKESSHQNESNSIIQMESDDPCQKKKSYQNNSQLDFDSAPSPSLIELEETGSLEQTWIGPGAPLGSSKAMAEAFRNRLNREPTNGDIEITVICNDTGMEEERDIVDEIYGSREELPFNVSIYRQLTAEKLWDVFEEDTDFLHYIGHIDEVGFECINGRFDASQLSKTGADAFFLNACTSYQQGKHLIEAGSIAGVVTLQDVINSGAERIGRSLAQLLNCGFPLRAALNIAKTQSIMGGHYLVIGDGNLDIAQSASGIPALYEINNMDGDEFELLYRTFPTRHKSMGSMILPHVSGNDQYYLASGDAGTYKLGKPELRELFEKETLPILSNQSLFWSDDVDFLTRYDAGF